MIRWAKNHLRIIPVSFLTFLLLLLFAFQYNRIVKWTDFIVSVIMMSTVDTVTD